MIYAALGCTHGHLPDPKEFKGVDVAIHTGDIGPPNFAYHHAGENWINDVYIPWIQEVNKYCPKFVQISGNRDGCLRENPSLLDGRCFYLCDEQIVIDDTVIYGTPWSLTFGNWAFMTDEDRLEEIYLNIPKNVDILVSHCPPYGYGDITERGVHAGSKAFRDAVLDTNPMFVVCSHIHESRGMYKMPGGPVVLNASLLDASYQLVNGITTFEL